MHDAERIAKAAEHAPNVLPTYLGEIVADMLLMDGECNNPPMLADEILDMPIASEAARREAAKDERIEKAYKIIDQAMGTTMSTVAWHTLDAARAALIEEGDDDDD